MPEPMSRIGVDQSAVGKPDFPLDGIHCVLDCTECSRGRALRAALENAQSNGINMFEVRGADGDAFFTIIFKIFKVLKFRHLPHLPLIPRSGEIMNPALGWQWSSLSDTFQHAGGGSCVAWTLPLTCNP